MPTLAGSSSVQGSSRLIRRAGQVLHRLRRLSRERDAALHLAGKVLDLDLDNVVAGYDDEAEVARGHVEVDAARLAGRCCGLYLLGGGLTILIRVRQHNILILEVVSLGVLMSGGMGSERGPPHCVCALESTEEHAAIGSEDAEVLVEERSQVLASLLFVHGV